MKYRSKKKWILWPLLLLELLVLFGLIFYEQKTIKSRTSYESHQIEKEVEPEFPKEDIGKTAEAEIRRFQEQYGVEISKDEMIRQLWIRQEYEEMYGRSYELEEVFLSEVITDPAIGDEGWEED